MGKLGKTMGRGIHFITLLAIAVSCSPKQDRAKVSFQLPGQLGVLPKNLSSLSLSDPYQWGLQDFSDISEVGCYAVMVKKSEEAQKAKNICQKGNGEIVAEIDKVYGLYPAGSVVELEMDAGLGQEVFLVGLGSQSACLELPLQEAALLSSPQIMASASVDLEPGDEVEVEMNIDLNNSEKFQDCNGLFVGTPMDHLLALSVSDAVVPESDGGVIINLSHPAPKSMTIDWQVIHAPDVDGLTTTAESTDFVALSGTVVVPEGATSVEVPVISDDNVHEDSQSFQFHIIDSSAGDIAASDSQAQITIGNDEVLPSVSFQNATSITSEANPSHNLTVLLSHASEYTISVGTSVVANTANNGTDFNYTPGAGSIVFSPHTTSQVTVVSPINDGLSNGTRDAAIQLFGPSNAVLGATISHTFSITSDE